MAVTDKELQQQRLRAPPPTGDQSLDYWLREVQSTLNAIPPMSYFSYDTPESNVSAIYGTLGLNVKSDATKVWYKESGETTTNWVSLVTPGSGIQYAACDGKDGVVAITGIAQTPVSITGWTGVTPQSSLISANASTGSITVSANGIYWCAWASSFSGTANVTYQGHIVSDSGDTIAGFHRRLGSGGDVGSAACMGLSKLTSGDVVGCNILAESGSGRSFGQVDGEFAVIRMSPGP